MAQLHDYNTGEAIREASLLEHMESVEAAKHDGGAGVILVNGRACYVPGDLPTSDSMQEHGKITRLF